MNALQHRKADNLRAVKAILEYHYVDDFVDSFESVAEAIKVTKQVSDIHKHAGFTLRHFASNSPDVSKSLGCDEDSFTSNCHLNLRLFIPYLSFAEVRGRKNCETRAVLLLVDMWTDVSEH
ncbi:PREDICTED: uncharacterized protein LOC108368035 isoform X2 [Rhagoletis zephyria]|uniref:uncharacterized protein LOC108368035 isoform X2 n=1 Tax=Rhagoletis zephyria TaxID=28612 RepID=UPI00081176C6|nr:PREDICTED: uncharacterized protein LOC108368035 isoform X2 [Rhagoletis zephyria]